MKKIILVEERAWGADQVEYEVSDVVFSAIKTTFEKIKDLQKEVDHTLELWKISLNQRDKIIEELREKNVSESEQK